jgi:hypothetical protein
MINQDNMTARAPFGVARDLLASGAEASATGKANTGNGRLVLLAALTQPGALDETVTVELFNKKTNALDEYNAFTLPETLTSPLVGKGVAGSKLRQGAIRANVLRSYFGMGATDNRAPALWTAWLAVLPVACGLSLQGVRMSFELGGKETAKTEKRPVTFRVAPATMEDAAIAAATAAQAAFDKRGFAGLKAWAEGMATGEAEDDGAKGHATDEGDHGVTIANNAALQSAAMHHFMKAEGILREWTSPDGECSVALPAEGSLDWQRLRAMKDMLDRLLAD